MNHAYRLVWNAASASYVPAPESARRHGKAGSVKTLVAAIALLSGATTFAADLPAGGQIVNGAGSISQSGSTLNINQGSNKLIANWQSFDIAAGHTVNFVQPGASAVALNRVLGNDASQIYGSLNANGKVFLVNPNGVLFGAGASVNVGGLVASTLNISDNDFLAGNYVFTGKGKNSTNASVINQGSIKADGGVVALLGGTVSNRGVIQANLGAVALAAGNKVALDFAGDGLLSVRVDESALNALAENHELIKADGGSVLLTAKATDALLQTVVNNTGLIQAQTLQEKDGKIILMGGFEGGTTHVAGTLDSSAPTNGDGGFIETSGAHVQIADDVLVTTQAENGNTGSWLIDPIDFTIAEGSAGPSNSGIGATTLMSALASSNVSVITVAGGSEAGNINVNAALNWSANTLTLSAHNNININATLALSGNAGISLNYGGSNGSAAVTPVAGSNLNIMPGKGRIDFSSGLNGLSINGSAYTLVFDVSNLQAINGNLGGRYALAKDIDASATTGWNAGAGFDPLGDSATKFTGVFDGLGHVISGLTINRSGEDYVGLFGYAEGATLRNVGLQGGAVSGLDFAGGLAGYLSLNSSISQSYAMVTVTGRGAVGGLAGYLVGNSSISQSYATGTVAGIASVGGLAGSLDGSSISQSYATVAVAGTGSVGGLAGSLAGSSISQSYATGSVTGNDYVGGLAGYLTLDSSISQSYATGVVTGNDYVGGLAGSLRRGSISQSYATGSVTGNDHVGGLTGYLVGSSGFNSFSISQSYATGSVTGNNYVGGLAGSLTGSSFSISNSYWNTETSGQTTSAGGIGLTTAQMFDRSHFAGFDFSAVWGNGGDQTTPYLLGLAGNQVFNKNDVPASVSSTSRPALYTAILDVNQLQAMAEQNNLGRRFVLGNDVDASATAMWNGGAGFVPVGTQNMRFTGIFDGLGHTISTLTINLSAGYAGLFHTLGNTAQIRNLVLENADIEVSTASGYNGAAVLAAINDGGSITNVRVVGGTVTVSGATPSFAGGLVAYNQANGSVLQSSASATVSVAGVTAYAGGLIGYMTSGLVAESYATGDVAVTGTSTTWAGGLVGYKDGGTVQQSYASGNVSASGGAQNIAGGLAGLNNNGSTIAQSYATGAVSTQGGAQAAGGLVGYNYGSVITDSYWNKDVISTGVGEGVTTGATGLTTVQIRDADSFSSWDIDSVGGQNTVWRIYEGHSAPLLKAFLTRLDIAVDNSSVIYSGQTQTGNSTYSITGPYDSSLLLGSDVVTGSGSNAGNYSLGLSGLYSSQQGYDLVITEGQLTINKAVLTVTASSVGKTYDGLSYTGGNGVSYAGLMNGETGSVLGGTLTYGGDSQGAVNVGSYRVDISGLTSGNYDITHVSGVLVIDKAELTVSANNANKAYDGLSYTGGNSVSYAGFANGETDSVLGGVLTYGGDAQGAVNVGNYTIEVSGLTSGNYAIIYTDAELAVNKAVLTVSAESAGKTYDGLAYTGGNGVSYSGFVNGETISVLGGVLTYGGDAQGAVNAGNYTIEVSGLSSSNYAITYADAELAVNKATLTVSAESAGKTYDGLAYTGGNGVSYSGFVNGETISVLGGALTYGGDAQGAVNAGNYTIEVSGLSSSNYDITYADADLLVTPAPLVITANDLVRPYNGSGFSGGSGVSYSGFVNGENVSVLGGAPAYGGNAQGASAMGDYVISVGGLSSGNYSISYVDGRLKITAPQSAVTPSLLSSYAGAKNSLSEEPLLAAPPIGDFVLEINGDGIRLLAVPAEPALASVGSSPVAAPLEISALQPVAAISPLQDVLPAPGTVLFSSNSPVLDEEEARRLLKALADRLKANPQERVRLVGHTDNTGTERYNSTLSQKRADEVARVLQSLGVASAQIEIMGDGFRNPLDDNKNRQGRARNRRVDFVLP